MREATLREKLAQASVALVLIVPLLAAFQETHGLADATGTWQPPDAGAQHARQMALLFAGLHSLGLGLLSALLALLIGVPAGWALARPRRPLWLLVIVALPLALPASVAVSGWVKLCAPGAVSTFAMPYTASVAGISGLLFSTCGAAMVLAAGLWPIVAFETWPAFKQIRNESFDAALLSGSRARAFFKIALPQAKGELAAGALLVFLLAASDFSVSSLLLVRTLPVEIHDALISGKTASAAWASLPLLCMAAAFSLMLAKLAGRPREQLHGTAAPTLISQNESSKAPVLALALLAGGILLGFVVPLAACMLGAFSGGQPMSRIYGLGSESLGITLRLAGAAAVISLLAGMARLIAWPETRARALNAAGLFFLAIPGSFLAAGLLAVQNAGVGWARALNAEVLGAVLPAAVLALGYTLRFIYLPMRLVEEGLSALDPDLLDAAALAGHGRLSRAVSIAFPLVLSHLAAGMALVFILSLGEIPIADKLHSPGVTPATIWLFQQQHLGYDESVFGLSLLLGGMAAGALFAAGLAAALFMKLFQRVQTNGFELT